MPRSHSGNTGTEHSQGTFPLANDYMNAQGDPFMWINPMFNLYLNMGDSSQEMIDKMVQEILGTRQVRNETIAVPSTGTVTSSSCVNSVVTATVTNSDSSQNVEPTLTTGNKSFDRLAPSSQYEDVSDKESIDYDQVSIRAGSEFSDQGQNASTVSELALYSANQESFSEFDSNNNLQWSGFMSKVASVLNIDT